MASYYLWDEKKALISCAVTAQLISIFVFACANSCFFAMHGFRSYDKALSAFDQCVVLCCYSKRSIKDFKRSNTVTGVLLKTVVR